MESKQRHHVGIAELEALRHILFHLPSLLLLSPLSSSLSFFSLSLCLLDGCGAHSPDHLFASHVRKEA
jgi:hypothetical protein